MADSKRVVYHSLREGREAGYVFYPGWVKAPKGIDQTTNQPKDPEDTENLFNEGIFTLDPGDNYLTDHQIQVLLATSGMQEKVDNKIIELDAQFDMLGAKPQTQTEEQLTQEAQTTVQESTETVEENPVIGVSSTQTGTTARTRTSGTK